jgi:hypothetical protein
MESRGAAMCLAASAESWFVPALQMLPLAARRCLVRNPLNGASMELSSGEYAVLSACEGCRPLAEHEAQAAKQLSAPEAHRPAFREVLERCAQQGLLISLPDLVARFGAPSEAAPIPIGGIAIRTADRPNLLARLLASAEALEGHGAKKRRWLVFDDSRNAAHEQANRAAIEACPALDVAHFGRGEAAALEDELRAEFPHAEREIAWLLGAGSAGDATYGRPVNHALLRFAGRPFITVDDDVVLDARRPALAEAGFTVSDETDDLRWYDSEESLWCDCPPLDIDPLAEHAAWLGMPMAAAWARADREAGRLASIELRGAQGQQFAADARVLFTHNHACGDPGSSVLPTQLLTLPKRSREWLAANPRATADAFAHRINWRGQTRLRLAPRRVLTFTTMAGIDNSRLMPPAARTHRSEDVLLGVVAQCMYPAAWLVDLPFGMPHLREAPKQWLSSADNFMQEPLHVLYGFVDEHAAGIVAESPERRLAAAAALLLDVAGMDEATLYDALLHHAVDAGSRMLFAIAEQLDDATLPAQWKAQLAPWLKSPALAVDADSVRARVLAPVAVRSLAGDYGRAMQAWPRLWECCRERFQ